MKKMTPVFLVLFCLVFVFILSKVSFQIEKSMTFIPSREVSAAYINFPVKELYIENQFQEKLHAWYIDQESEKLVIYFHGNAGTISDRQQQLEIIANLGFNVLIFDYQEYGKSQGVIESEKELYEDSLSVLEYANNILSYSNDKIIVWGRSLGVSFATDIAARKNFSAVVLESGFSSMQAMASSIFKMPYPRFLLHFKFDNLSKIPKVSAPILIVHSRDDEIIPFSHAEDLYQAISGTKSMLEISGDHNNGYFESKNKYLETLRKFFNK